MLSAVALRWGTPAQDNKVCLDMPMNAFWANSASSARGLAHDISAKVESPSRAKVKAGRIIAPFLIAFLPDSLTPGVQACIAVRNHPDGCGLRRNLPATKMKITPPRATPPPGAGPP